MASPGCGKVDHEQEARWEAHKRDCLARFREMERAQDQAKRIAAIPDLEGRRGELAKLEAAENSEFVGTVKSFMRHLWATRKA